MTSSRYRFLSMNNLWSLWYTKEELDAFLKTGDSSDVLAIQSEEVMTREEARNKYGIEVK